MRIATAFLVAAVFLLTGCVGIPKPDWNPGNTPPAPQTGERQTCPLPAQWGWSKKYKQWVCAPMYYLPPYSIYYGPSFPHIPVYPPVIGPCCLGGYQWRQR